MDTAIKNIDDLHLEIARLTAFKQEQKVALGARFSSPSAIFSTLISIFPSGSGNGNGSIAGVRAGSFFNMDIVSMLSRVLLPFTLNKTLFRNSNFIVKALVNLASQKASGLINEGSVGGIWDKAKSLFSSITGKKNSQKLKRIKAYSPPM